MATTLHKTHAQHGRIASDNASRRLLRAESETSESPLWLTPSEGLSLSTKVLQRLPTDLVQDNRRWTPNPYLARPLDLWGRPTRIDVPRITRRTTRSTSQGSRPNNPTLFSFSSLAFQTPKSVLICVRRKRRKEVMHALRHAGRSVRNFKPRRRNFYSSVSCR